MTTPTQGTFVSRTKTLDKPNSYTSTFIVSASSTYEPTGSFKNTAFFVESGTGYTLSPLDGGSNITAGLVTGQVYKIALKKIVNTAGTQVVLLK